MTHEEMIKVYERLQREYNYGTAPMDETRAERIAGYIAATCPAGATVLDASCGRGHLLRRLKDKGFLVCGTEASKWLIDNALQDFDVRHMLYSQLSELPDDACDAVVSDDVLEHLFTEAEVDEAIDNLVRISRHTVCISVGLNHAPRTLDGKQYALHNIVRNAQWWLDTYKELCVCEQHFQVQNSYFMFGRKK